MDMSSKDMNLEDKKIKRIKLQSAIAFGLGLLLLIVSLLIGGIIFINSIFAPGKDIIAKTESSDGRYKVEAYLINGGATTDWTVRCYLKVDKKLGKKVIYNDYHINYANMSWIDEDTILINGHEIDLPDGEYEFRYQQ